MWFVDRMRGTGFVPYTVTPCTENSCTPLDHAQTDNPWRVFTAEIDETAFAPFSATNHCTWVGEVLENHATSPGIDMLLEHMQSRGTVAFTPVPGSDQITIAPGSANETPLDAALDIIMPGTPRGCFPSRYGVASLVFWAWLLCVSVVNFRNSRRDPANTGV